MGLSILLIREILLQAGDGGANANEIAIADIRAATVTIGK